MPYRPPPPAPIEFAELEQVRLEQWLLDAALAHHHRIAPHNARWVKIAWLGLVGFSLGAITGVDRLAIAGLGLVLISGAFKFWGERRLWALIASAEARGLEPHRMSLMPLFSDDRGFRALGRCRTQCQRRLRWLTLMLEPHGSDPSA